MRISDQHKFLFVHVQKTGGVTVERIVDDLMPDARWFHPGKRHLTLRQILEREPGLAKYWTMGCVRNPWARMLSWWSMIEGARIRAEKGGQKAQHMLERLQFWRETAEYPDFDTFLERGPEEHDRLRRPQINYLTTSTRRADFIGRTESLSADIRAVCTRLGLPAPEEVPRVNKTKVGGDSYRDHYSANGRDRVAELFRKDIDAFAYEY